MSVNQIYLSLEASMRSYTSLHLVLKEFKREKRGTFIVLEESKEFLGIQKLAGIVISTVWHKINGQVLQLSLLYQMMVLLIIQLPSHFQAKAGSFFCFARISQQFMTLGMINGLMLKLQNTNSLNKHSLKSLRED